MNFYTLSDLGIGKEEQFTVRVTKEMQETFAELTGDMNPMHLDDVYAKKNGFNKRIVYGMLTASFYSTLAGVYLPGERCLLHGCDVAWNKPVYIGDELTVKGIVKDVDERFQRVIIKATITNQKGEKVSKATIIAGVRTENQ